MEPLNSKTEKLEEKDLRQAQRNLDKAREELKKTQDEITKALNKLDSAQSANIAAGEEFRNAHQYLFQLQKREAEEQNTKNAE